MLPEKQNSNPTVYKVDKRLERTFDIGSIKDEDSNQPFDALEVFGR